jgi:hypothetical protein
MSGAKQILSEHHTFAADSQQQGFGDRVSELCICRQCVVERMAQETEHKITKKSKMNTATQTATAPTTETEIEKVLRAELETLKEQMRPKPTLPPITQAVQVDGEPMYTMLVVARHLGISYSKLSKDQVDGKLKGYRRVMFSYGPCSRVFLRIDDLRKYLGI